MARAWSRELELKGAGGEPVDLRRTLASHGVADLPPNVIEDEAARLTKDNLSGRTSDAEPCTLRQIRVGERFATP